MPKPMISVAGIRGTIGGSLVPEEFLKFAAAYCSTLKNPVLVLGTDTRPSRRMVRHLVLAAAAATGCKVLDLGICPTPTVGLMTGHLGAGGAIAVTASHNPLEWNALKFFSNRGIFLTANEMKGVLDRYAASDFAYRSFDRLGSVETVEAPLTPHLERVLAAVDAGRIASRGFRVAIDLCNGAGLELLPALLESLGCKVQTVFADPDKAFERVAEPLPENLAALSQAVRAFRADVGFAVDPDADRLALVDETSRPIGEERTLTLASRHVLGRLERGAGPLVANLSTTRALDDVAAEFGTRVERTRIGEAHVVERILATDAPIGGEGNGGVIYPPVHPGRDAATGIALVLEAMAAPGGGALSALNAQAPDYAMVKRKVDIEDRTVAAIYDRLRQTFEKDARAFDDRDGLKIEFADSWVHVRPSGTEPIVRVFAEAPDPAQADSLADRAMQSVQD
ncbi:phosphoglucosamine mutase [Candidatus Sumerlaeota bacterium]|nr:phosphoglucosamine mutase [Candidatus Sumerlaeota bacterium]